MPISLPLPTALTVLAVAALLTRNRLAAITAGILFLNWVSETSVCLLTDDYYPVLFFIVADYGAALAIFLTRRSHWQSAVMGVYACQLVCHAAYALSDMGVAPTYYSYWALTYMAWVQVALIGGWIGTDLVGRWLPVSSSRRTEANASAMVAGEKK